MSVILMSGKKSAQKFKEGSGNKSKDKYAKDKNLTSVNSYMPSETVDVWNCVINGTPVSIAFCKDSFEIWCNDSLIIPQEQPGNKETKLNFELMSRKVRITISYSDSKNSTITKTTMTIDGDQIPHVSSIEGPTSSAP